MRKIVFDGSVDEFIQSAYIIAEIGQAHDGSLGNAYAYIDAAAEAGVDAVKFQTHLAHAESTKHEHFRVKVFPQDQTRYDYWERMEFTSNQWQDLADYARSKGLEFLSTPFSVEAVRLLEKIDIPYWKVGSGDINNTALIDAILETKKPVLLSSGMSTYEELELTVEKIRNAGVDFAIFQCTTSYPCPPEEIGYNILSEMKERFGCLVGLSDHSGTPFPSLASIALGAKLVEVHVVFSKRCFGPDTNSSLTIEELADLVKGVRFIEKGLFVDVDKNSAATNREATKKLFSRSAFYTCDMSVGDMITSSHFSMKKPGGGLSYEEARKLIGKTIKIDRKFDDFVTTGDFNE